MLYCPVVYKFSPLLRISITMVIVLTGLPIVCIVVPYCYPTCRPGPLLAPCLPCRLPLCRLRFSCPLGLSAFLRPITILNALLIVRLFGWHTLPKQ